MTVGANRASGCNGSRGVASAFQRRYDSIDQRNGDAAIDYTNQLSPYGDAPYRSRLTCLEADGVRISSVRDRGGASMRIAWRSNAFGALFVWGDGTTVDGVVHDRPSLILAGPGTEFTRTQAAATRQLRIGVSGNVLERLSTDPTTAAAITPWLKGGVFRPRIAADAEWNLQQRILTTTSFVDAAVTGRVAMDTALAVASEEVVTALVDALTQATNARVPEPGAAAARHRLVDAALEVLAGAEDEPVSVARVCRTLGVGERTLQRAFQERLGIGPRAYERQRRLRGVHGAILTVGDQFTVTEIAMSFGFWHLGRFAGAYADMFGCSPSETRRRVWGIRPGRPRDP